MSDITADVFKIVQSYGGLKCAYVEFNTVTAGDVMKFESNEVAGIKMSDLRLDADGAFVAGVPADTDLTVGAGPAAAKVVGLIYFRSY